MLRKLERDHLQADLAAVEALLADRTDEEDPIGFFQYHRRKKALEEKISQFAVTTEDSATAIALFFCGRPVLGSQGIDANFASQAVGAFQDLVQKRFAALEQGPLSARGPVPFRAETQLIVTDVARGSFGFVLESAVDTQPEAQTKLKTVVDEVANTIACMGSSDEALFDTAAQAVDERFLGKLKEFFKLLDDEGATLRLVEGERDLELDQFSIQRARQRVDDLVVEERVEKLQGIVLGWSAVRYAFDLRRFDTQGIISGNVRRALIDRIGADSHNNPYGKSYEVTLSVREVRERNRSPKLAYTLIDMQEITRPPGSGLLPD